MDIDVYTFMRKSTEVTFTSYLVAQVPARVSAELLITDTPLSHLPTHLSIHAHSACRAWPFISLTACRGHRSAAHPHGRACMVALAHYLYAAFLGLVQALLYMALTSA